VITIRATSRLWLPVLVFLATLASSSKVPSSTADIESLDLNLMLQRLEEAQHQDPAQSRPYEVIREYKVFRGDEKQPTSEVMAQINFAPPATKTYTITQARGNSAGEKMVRELLDQRKDSVARSGGRIMISFFFGKRPSASCPSMFCGSFRSGRIKTCYAGGPGLMRGCSVSAELKECPPKAPPFGSRIFISPCNLQM
jgi:hypothetical protein